MKHLLTVLLAAATIIPAAGAGLPKIDNLGANQPAPCTMYHMGDGPVRLSPEQIAKQRTEKLDDDLNLTNFQFTEVYKAHLQYAQKAERLCKKEALNETATARLKSRLDKKLSKILTPVQYRELHETAGK